MMKSTEGVEIPTSLAEWCDPHRMALVVYDMQVGICRQVADADAIIGRTGAVLEAARSVGMRVAFTRHVSLPNKWMGMTQLRTAMAWQRCDDPDAVTPWFLRDAEATRIVADLEPRADEPVFDKLTMSAFDSTPLALALRDCEVRAVAFVGIAMEIGIEPTVRQATDHGFVAAVIEDACGFGSREARDRSMATLRFIGEAIITDVATFCATLSGTGGGGRLAKR
jgi:biuret amidohydrolase